MKQKVFTCKECGLKYSSQNLAKKCQAWCQKNKSCNPGIAKLSIDLKNK